MHGCSFFNFFYQPFAIMRAYFSLLVFYLFSLPILPAQYHDNNMIWADPYSLDTFGLIRKFSEDSILFKPWYVKTQMFRTNCSYSDSAGSFLLFSDGCSIYDSESNPIENGLINQILGCPNDGLGINSWGWFLPYPGAESEKVFISHMLIQNPYFIGLAYTVIDLNSAQGKPEVIEKNIKYFPDTIIAHNAVKHANGRDWWIVALQSRSNNYSVYLLDPSGLQFKHKQNIGLTMNRWLVSELVFSPNGKKLAYSNPQDDLRVFDFDRQTGMLSNPESAIIHDGADTINLCCGGMAFSADSKYIYRSGFTQKYATSGNSYLQQFDVTVSGKLNDWKEVAVFDLDSIHWLSNQYGHFELGADGRIYIRASCGGCAGMSILMHPEREGAASGMRNLFSYQQDQHFSGMPVFPNYRLGPIDGSPCDTLALNNYPLAGFRYDRLAGLLVDFTSVSWYEPETWLWNFGDPASGASNTSSEMHPNHVFSAPGYYNVCLTVSNQYGSDSICKRVYIDASVDTQEPQLTETEQGVLVYPNPATAWVEFLFPEQVSGALSLYSVNGAEVFTQNVENATRTQAQVSTLPSGVYAWALREVSGYVWRGKVVVVR
jgi:PKD domain/Secretion system C-terminal sorting domain